MKQSGLIIHCNTMRSSVVSVYIFSCLNSSDDVDLRACLASALITENKHTKTGQENEKLFMSPFFQVSMDAEMAEEIEELGAELEEQREEEEETEEDRIYRDNLRLTGMDKYKTLREVRKGNTKRRIDVFENM